MEQSGGLSIHNPFTGVPVLAKILAAVVGVLMIIGLLVPQAAVILSLNVGYTIPPYFFVWTIVTSGFFNSSLFSGIFDIIAILFAGKFLEPIWGSKEFLRFVLIVNTIAGASSFLLMVILFAITRNENLLFYTNLCGFVGVSSGFTVAVKQLVPDQEINIFLAFKMKAKHLPGVVIVAGIVQLISNMHNRHLPHMLFGMVGSWVYLRFYQRKGEVVGDLSDSFAFATFWPEPLRPFVTLIARILSYPLRVVGIMPTPTSTSSYSSPYSINLTTSASAPAGPDAERRRALAQRAVDQRMAIQTKTAIPTTTNTYQPTKITNSMMMPMDTNPNDISASTEIIPDLSPPSLYNASSRPSHQPGDKT